MAYREAIGAFVLTAALIVASSAAPAHDESSIPRLERRVGAD
jgi:hypothetical protein